MKTLFRRMQGSTHRATTTTDYRYEVKAIEGFNEAIGMDPGGESRWHRPQGCFHCPCLSCSGRGKTQARCI